MHIEDGDFFRLCEYMRTRFGINLEKKKTLIEGRLASAIVEQGYTGFHDYIDAALRSPDGELVNTLVTNLTTNYTYFMREEAHYKFMMQSALPALTAAVSDNDLRIWSAGCASGEEAYTLAMLLSEYFGPAKAAWDTTLLATDISPKVLEIARYGVYAETHLKGLSPALKAKYFRQVSQEEWQVTESIRKEVLFNQFNLMGDFSRFRRKFHIIFCRNVMIYFNTETKAALAKKFYDALCRGGYLFVGLSETLSGVSRDFRQVAPSIYVKE